jgi:hypothetical protein
MSSSSPPVHNAADEGPLATLRLALWFGLLAGLGEVALLAARKYVLHRLILVSKDAVWMAPLADVVLFVGAGILVAGLRAVLPRRLRPAPVLVFAALAAFTLLLMYQPLYRPAAALLALGIGTVALRAARRWSAAFNALVARSFPIMVIVVLLAAGAVHIQAAAKEGRQPSGDDSARRCARYPAHRSGRGSLWNPGAYGYSRPTTPRSNAGCAMAFAGTAMRPLRGFAVARRCSPGAFARALGGLAPAARRPQPTLTEALRAGPRYRGVRRHRTLRLLRAGLARGFSHYGIT